MFVAPMERVFTPPLPKQILWQTDCSSFVIPDDKPQSPSFWQMPIIKEDRSLFAEGIREASKEETIYNHCWRLLSQTILAQL